LGKPMQAAISTLEIALDVLLTNEPINRAEGNVEQADFEAKSAEDIRKAVECLSACAAWGAKVSAAA
jgi:hypothetical protein